MYELKPVTKDGILSALNKFLDVFNFCLLVHVPYQQGIRSENIRAVFVSAGVQFFNLPKTLGHISLTKSAINAPLTHSEN